MCMKILRASFLALLHRRTKKGKRVVRWVAKRLSCQTGFNYQSADKTIKEQLNRSMPWRQRWGLWVQQNQSPSADSMNEGRTTCPCNVTVKQIDSMIRGWMIPTAAASFWPANCYGLRIGGGPVKCSVLDWMIDRFDLADWVSWW